MERGKALKSVAAKRDLGNQGELFSPSRRQAMLLGALVLAALAAALYLRYGIIENTQIGFACDAGDLSFMCRLRLATVYLFNATVFGAVAIAAACLQLCRPNIVTFGIGLIFAAFGVVLYNTRLSALALTFLILSLARLVRADMRAKAE
jgi:hypothetical protein